MNPANNQYSKLSDLLDKVITRYDSYTHSIENQINVIETSLENRLQDTTSKSENEILEDLSTDLLRKRPLSKMEENSKTFYKYISKLGRDIDKLQQVPARDLHLYDIDFDHKSLKESIGEYLLHQVLHHERSPKNLNQLKEIIDELGLISHKELDKKFKIICDIRQVLESLETKDLGPLKKWISKHSSKLKKKVKSELGCKYLVLKAYQNIFELEKSVNETIQELKAEKKIMFNSKKQSLQRLFGSLVFLKNPVSSQDEEGKINDANIKDPEALKIIKQRYG